MYRKEGTHHRNERTEHLLSLLMGSRSGFIVVILKLHFLIAILLFLPLCLTPGGAIIIPRPFLG